MSDLIYPELSYRIVGAAFAVYNTLGPFYVEPVYQHSTEIELIERGIYFNRKVPLDLEYRSYHVGDYELDLIVEKKIIVELKAVETLHPKHTSQILQYLAMTGKKLGILVNYGNLDKLQFKRVPFGRKTANESH